MKISILLIFISAFNLLAEPSYSQSEKISLKLTNVNTIENVISEIERTTDYVFIYNEDVISTLNNEVNVEVSNQSLDEILNLLLEGTDLAYSLSSKQVTLYKDESKKAEENSSTTELLSVQQQTKKSITGAIVDEQGEPIIGANVIEKGTNSGTITDVDGRFSLNVSDDVVLSISYIGYLEQEIVTEGRKTINVILQEDTKTLDEVVVIGYGTMKKSDLTGAVSSLDMEDFRDQAGTSFTEGLQGAVAGLNVSQVDQAGQGPSISVRGRTSLSGAQSPLIVLDGVIFRGQIIDINPNDIQSIDVLKDNSAAAVYGSQAANGVVIITTQKRARNKAERPTITYSAKYSFESPAKELKPGGAEHFIEKISEHEWRESRTAESGYIEKNFEWDFTSLLKTNQQKENYLAGMDTDWYGLLTNDNMYINNHNLSVSNQSNYGNYFISLGYTDQKGYMINEGYERLNARINIDSDITDWFTVGVQAFASVSDNSGKSPGLDQRYIIPFEAAYYDGELNPLVENTYVSPLVVAESENKDVRQNLFGNIFADIDIPFVKGLSYKINVANNQVMNRYYDFEPFAHNFQGYGQKYHNISNDLSVDNNLSFKRRFNDIHNLEVNLVYGVEKRKYDYTKASSSNFVNDVLGYNKLDFGDSELQVAESGAWEETSLFTMSRVFYSLKNKYLFTGTFRRDGFSGFSEDQKFGYFPSGSIAWVASEESFFRKWTDVMNYLKLRVSYGSNGNRTVGRYQTLAKVAGGYNYVDAEDASIYTQFISSLASPALRWETTTGINVGIDFGFLDSRINGSINYYNNNTKNLLYTVDIPSIGRFDKFPDNLGKIHNHGVEISVSSVNIKTDDFRWSTDFSFSRNRDELKELLGVDKDGDGKEDDLISERLFIGHSLNTIYDYDITGEKFQLGDEIPSGFDVGTNIIVNQTPSEGEINPETDRIILGYRDPAYRFSINNKFQYKNWTFSLFINSLQGGKNYYMQENDVHELQYGDQFNSTYPEGYDNYWLPENPDAKYQKKSDTQIGNLRGKNYNQRSFIRLQNVSLGYKFDSQFLSQFKINGLHIFLSGKNLLTITDWEGWDPETGAGITRHGRPVLKSYTIGLNIEF